MAAARLGFAPELDLLFFLQHDDKTNVAPMFYSQEVRDSVTLR
jgi:hypothetical protein